MTQKEFKKLKVGDRVVLTGVTWSSKGKKGTVSSLSGRYADVLEDGDKDGDTWNFQEEDIDLPEKEKPEEPKCKFKVGDKVRIISNEDNFSEKSIGYCFIVKEIFDDNWCREFKGESTGVCENSLELVVEENTVPMSDSFRGIEADACYIDEANNLNNNKPKKTFMSTIKNALKSTENKALEYFNLRNTAEGGLNTAGRAEFTDYIYDTGDATKKGFLEKIVSLYKEETKRK